MSAVIQFPLKKNPRPVIAALLNGVASSCLVDTGAEIPVWTATERKFLRRFPDALLLNDSFTIKGFGGSGTQYKIYKIPCLTLCDSEGNSINIHNCVVAVGTMDKVKFQFIVSATMLHKAKYAIDNTSQLFTVDCGRNDYYMILAEDGKSVTVFEQRETLKDMFSNATGNK